MKRIKAVLNNADLKQKAIYTLMILLIFRLGIHISVPGVDLESIKLATTGSGAGIFAMMNMLGGDALQNYSIFGLGVMPYITASIVIQLLAMDIVPYFSDLKNSGEAGRKKLSQLTRYAAIVLSFGQAYALTYAFNVQQAAVLNPTFFGFVQIALIMTAGAIFLLWLADQITTKGLGNGTSMIIFAGIVDKVPVSFYRIMESYFNSSNISTIIAIIVSIGIVILFLALVVFTVFTQQATRKIPVQYANNSSQAGSKTYLPFKINVAGVIPVIFASAVLMAPQTILQLFAANESGPILNFARQLFDYTTPIGLLLYIALIFGFTFFYANLQVDAKKLAENLGRSGGYIIGIRPGEETMNFVKKTINKLNFLGASSLSLIAAIPVLLPMLTSLEKGQAYGLGGTGLIIVVGVALDIVNRIDSASETKSQKGFIL